MMVLLLLLIIVVLKIRHIIELTGATTAIAGDGINADVAVVVGGGGVAAVVVVVPIVVRIAPTAGPVVVVVAVVVRLIGMAIRGPSLSDHFSRMQNFTNLFASPLPSSLFPHFFRRQQIITENE